MNSRFTVLSLVSSVVFLSGAATTALASPLDFLLPFQQVEADPRKPYYLSEDDGPWLILAATFLGENGERQAHDLVIELRRDHKLPAYVYKKRFEYPEYEVGLGVDRYGRPKKMKPVHAVKFDEIAVLIGDFTAVDDSRAQTVREKIRYMQPNALKSSPGKPTYQRMVMWREIQRRLFPDEQKRKLGPMRVAFVTRNPLLPKENFAKQGPDTVILELNRGIKHSLLECSGQYTVRVATFRGRSTWDTDAINAAKAGAPIDYTNSKLLKAEDNARRLVAALRRKGVEAYQYHDRHESVVTVGAFDSVGRRRADGKIDLHPAIHKIMRDYGGVVSNVPGFQGAMQPRMLEGIPFDVQPLPVEVPRTSIAAQYQGADRRSYR